VKDPNGNFSEVLEAIGMIERGKTYAQASEATGIAPSTLSGVMERKARYYDEAGMSGSDHSRTTTETQE